MMNNVTTETLTTSKQAVSQASKRFAKALNDTPEFQAFEQASIDFQQDTEAQNVYQELIQKQQSLRAMMMLNAVSEEDQRDLQTLQDRFNRQPSIKKYMVAQQELMMQCQAVADRLSSKIGLNYDSVCRTGGCCG